MSNCILTVLPKGTNYGKVTYCWRKHVDKKSTEIKIIILTCDRYCAIITFAFKSSLKTEQEELRSQALVLVTII